MLACECLSWVSEKKTIVDVSTGETEYIALSTAARENIWLVHLAGDVVLPSGVVLRINNDNKTALQMSKESKLTEASKSLHMLPLHQGEGRAG